MDLNTDYASVPICVKLSLSMKCYFLTFYQSSPETAITPTYSILLDCTDVYSASVTPPYFLDFYVAILGDTTLNSGSRVTLHFDDVSADYYKINSFKFSREISSVSSTGISSSKVLMYLSQGSASGIATIFHVLGFPITASDNTGRYGFTGRYNFISGHPLQVGDNIMITVIS